MRDLIDSALIGSLASFLPFWIWQSRSDHRSNRVEWGDIRIQTVAYMECRMKKDPQSCNSGGPKR